MQVWADLFELLASLLAAGLVWRYVAGRLRPDASEPDDYAGVPARLKPRPRSGAGAVALAEPECGEEE